MYFVHPQIKLNRKIFTPLEITRSSEKSKENKSLTGFQKMPGWFWKKPNIKGLENNLSFLFPNKKIVFTDMGRTAFQIIIEKLNLRNSAMLIPAYVCDTFYVILKKYNISPIFIDTDLKTFNLNIEELEKKISPATKSILVSHIYGLPNDMEKILSIAKKYNLRIIEDCAHTFGASHHFSAKSGGRYIGNFGDAALFSLYKSFPCFRGGMLVCPKDWDITLSKTSFSLRDFISFLNCFPICAYFFKKFGSAVAPKIIKKEKSAQLCEINNVSLNIFSYFLKTHKQETQKRIELALFFQQELKNLGFETQESKNNVFCYVSALMPKNLKQRRDILIKNLRKYGIFATRIWHAPIILNPLVKKEYNINSQEFPNTIEAAQRIINFPLQNYFQKKDIQKIIKKLKLTLSTLPIIR